MSDFEPKQFGKYYLIDKLAMGGMAEIYKAKTFGVDGFEKQLAIKRILPHCVADKDFISMLIDEAKLSVVLSHANIVQVYDLGKLGDDYFISMEYISGANLRDLLQRCKDEQKKFPLELAVFIASEICKGLDYAHRKTDEKDQPLNIVHRDVSPQNILLSYEGEVKIVDFGIAKAAMNISHTMAGILKGKIAFMSPEQAMGKNVDHRTDIYSLGIILYEMLTGERLFAGESQFEVLKKIRTTKVTTAKLPKSIPDPLKEILVKSLAYNPDERYKNAGDMQIDLTKYLYSAHIDFTPRHLSDFVKSLFASEIKEAQKKSLAEAAITVQTSSIDFAQQAMQQNLVHRESEGATMQLADQEIMPTQAISLKSEDITSATVAEKAKGLRRRMFVTLVVVAALVTGGAYIYKNIIGGKIAPKPEPSKENAVGTLNISSTPDNAEITIDGQDTNLTTPAIVDKIKLVETHTVMLTKEGYVNAEEKVSIKSAEPYELNLTLSEKTGSLSVSSEPSGAAIFLNDKATGKVTPDILDTMSLNIDNKITLTKPNFEDYEQVINISTDKPQKLSAVLKQSSAVGSITITSNPAGSTIFLNGNPTNLTTPAVLGDLKVKSTYTIKLSKQGYADWKKTITVESSEQSSLTADLMNIASQGSFIISSTPSGALIFLNGKSTGETTPSTISNLKRGATYSIILKKDGFRNWSRSVRVEKESESIIGSMVAGASQEVVETPKTTQVKEKTAPSQQATTEQTSPLADSSATMITIKSRPSDADVYINGQNVGKTPFTGGVTPGMLTIVVDKEERVRFTQQIFVKPGEKKDVGYVSLPDLYGQMTISSTPSGATVYLDDAKIPAKTPVTIRKVTRDREHILKLELPGYSTWTTTFKMDKSKHQKFNVILEQ